jgi:hypothetical protein
MLHRCCVPEHSSLVVTELALLSFPGISPQHAQSESTGHQTVRIHGLQHTRATMRRCRALFWQARAQKMRSTSSLNLKVKIEPSTCNMALLNMLNLEQKVKHLDVFLIQGTLRLLINLKVLLRCLNLWL